jgi:hypothetical protein
MRQNKVSRKRKADNTVIDNTVFICPLINLSKGERGLILLIVIELFLVEGAEVGLIVDLNTGEWVKEGMKEGSGEGSYLGTSLILVYPSLLQGTTTLCAGSSTPSALLDHA